MKGTGSNRIPLGPASGNKRVYSAIIEMPSSPQKHLNDEARKRMLVHRPVDRQASTATNRHHETSEIQQTARQYPTQDRITRVSSEILDNARMKLRASIRAINEDRHALRQQWEVDDRLQLLSVSNDLAELNKCFPVAEVGIEDAIDVIESRLL